VPAEGVTAYCAQAETQGTNKTTINASTLQQLTARLRFQMGFSQLP